METESQQLQTLADQLRELYDEPFGGKKSGRYRLSAKTLRKMAGRRRLYESDIRELARAMFERGYILIDMESFFVVTSANSFVNYRRVPDDRTKTLN